MIAEVVFNIPLERSFHYAIPEAFDGVLQPGMRVAAPFGPRERIGCVTRLVAHSPIRELKSIRRIIDPLPVIADERWPLASWLSGYYACSLGEALAAMVPSQLRLASAEPTVLPEAHTADQPAPALQLTVSQRRACDAILKALQAGRARTMLLHGVTGSGKTELYLRAIDTVLTQGKSAVCLIPEIALTPQTIDRFRARFGDGVAVWHSRLSDRQRGREWQRMSRGTCRVVVGARSAVFAPVHRLGLIILDEEHETTYKQADTPRYHAREVARARAGLTNAVVLLGSATPSVESYYEAARRRGNVLSLPERVEGRALPAVEIVDLRDEFHRRRRAQPLSLPLERAVEQAVAREEQVLLLLNRRGFSRVVQCHGCGTVVRCPQCSVPLIYHAGRKVLLCHYCGRTQTVEEICPQCRKGYLRFRGTGTERVESELHRLFPTAPIARMDADTTKRRESHRDVYEAMKARRVMLLVGTQMIAKGLDFPHVTLVGVVSADTALNLPDFRAGERTFDLLTQVAGRAGRGKRPGRVIIQTYCPDHYAIRAAKSHDYRTFYAQEIAMRRRLALPPLTHVIELTLHGSSREKVEAAARGLAERLAQAGASSRAGTPIFTILGPAPHRIPRVRRTYRMCLIVKGKKVEPMVEVLRKTLQASRRFHGLPVTIDVDPL